MRSLLLVLGLVFGVMMPSCVSGPGREQAVVSTYFERISDDLAIKLSNSVFQITAFQGAMPYSRGSLVVVRHEDGTTVCLTAGHMVDDGVDSFAVIDSGLIYRGVCVDLGKFDESDPETHRGDWAILVFQGKFGVPLEHMLRAGRAPVGLEIVAIGYPVEGEKILRGVIMDRPLGGQPGLLFHNANTGPGSSGGAIIGLLSGKPTLLAIHTRRVPDVNGEVWGRAGVPISEIIRQGGDF